MNITFILLFSVNVIIFPSEGEDILKIEHKAQSDSRFRASIDLKGKIAYAEYQNNEVEGYANMNGNITIDDWGVETSIVINLRAISDICNTEIHPEIIYLTRLSPQHVDFRVQVIIPKETPAELEFSINVTGTVQLSQSGRTVQLNSKDFIAKMETYHHFWLQYHPSYISINRDRIYRIEPIIVNSGNSKDNYSMEVIVIAENNNDPEIFFELEKDYFEIPGFRNEGSYLNIIIGEEADLGEYKIILRITANKTVSNKKNLWVEEEVITVFVIEPEEYKGESGMFMVLMIGFIIGVVILTIFFLMVRVLLRWIRKRVKRDKQI